MNPPRRSREYRGEMKIQGASPTRYTVMEDRGGHIDWEQLVDLELQGADAAEDLRQALNDAVQKYQLSPEAVLYMFARLSAGYIHQMQSVSVNAAARDAVEDAFNEVLDFYLATYDKVDLMNEQKKMMS